MTSYYTGTVTQAAIDQAGDKRPGTSPLVACLRRVLGSTCRLEGRRVYRGDKPTSLVISDELVTWEAHWQAGAKVDPVAVWVASRPTVARTPTNEGAVRRVGQ